MQIEPVGRSIRQISEDTPPASGTPAGVTPASKCIRSSASMMSLGGICIWRAGYRAVAVLVEAAWSMRSGDQNPDDAARWNRIARGYDRAPDYSSAGVRGSTTVDRANNDAARSIRVGRGGTVNWLSPSRGASDRAVAARLSQRGAPAGARHRRTADGREKRRLTEPGRSAEE